MEYFDICIANEEDAEKSLGLNPADSNVDNDEGIHFSLIPKTF